MVLDNKKYVRKLLSPSMKAYIGGIAIALTGIITVLVLIHYPDINPLYFLFLYLIPSNTAISVFPHEPLVIFLGRQYNPLLIAFICNIATLVAAYIDHTVFTQLLNHRKLAGYRNKPLYKKLKYYFHKCPFWTIVIAGFSPVPFFPIKMLSFSCQYPLIRYLSAVVTGRFPRYFILAAFGATVSIPDWIIFLSSFLLIAASVIAWSRPSLAQIFKKYQIETAVQEHEINFAKNTEPQCYLIQMKGVV